MTYKSDVIFSYGEDRWAKRIAEFIVKERKNSPIETTGQLVSVIKKAVPKGARLDGPHPAKRTFQAIRIAVNSELDIIEPTLKTLISRLNKGGRLCVITFHSLEDRTVKEKFRQFAVGCTCPKDFPVCVCGKKPKAIVKSAGVKASNKELDENNRSRSAKLRTAVKIGE